MTNVEIIGALQSLQLTAGAETRQQATITRVPEGVLIVNEHNLHQVHLGKFVVLGVHCFAGYSPVTNTLYVADRPREHQAKNFKRVFVYEDGRTIEERVNYLDWSLPPATHFTECDADGQNALEYTVTHTRREQDVQYVYVQRRGVLI